MRLKDRIALVTGAAILRTPRIAVASDPFPSSAFCQIVLGNDDGSAL